MRFKPEGMTPNSWAMKAGVSRTVWADMRRHGNPSRRTLEKLLTAAGSSLAEFEALRVAAPVGRSASVSALLEDSGGGPWRASQLPGLPLIATAMAGEWGNPGSGIEMNELRTGELVDRVARPPSLGNDHTAYAIVVVGDSMWPRFRPGRRLAVSPKAPVAVGDDILLKLKAGSDSDSSGAIVPIMIKELVRRTGSGVELRQFNPEATFEVPAAEIAAIEKVVGELI